MWINNRVRTSAEMWMRLLVGYTQRYMHAVRIQLLADMYANGSQVNKHLKKGKNY